jgi:Inhibitor of vertebrate lysozyme (Ivy)
MQTVAHTKSTSIYWVKKSMQMFVKHNPIALSTLSAVAFLGLMQVPTAQAGAIVKFETLTEAQIKQSYYFDWNRNVVFRASVVKLFAANSTVMPAWVRQGSGPAAPADVAPVGGTQWVLVNTCKLRDCGNNVLHIAFHPPTRQAVGIAKLDGKLTWLGKPSGAMQQMLSQRSGLR